MSKAGEGHLLFYDEAEMITAHNVDERQRCVMTHKETRVEHGLECPLVGERQIDAPVGNDIAQSSLPVIVVKVGGTVSISSMETSAMGGEIPVVLGVKVGAGVIGEVVVVVERRNVSG